MNDTHKTQKIFFYAMTKKKLDELFHRASTNVMRDHINQRLTEPLQALTRVKEGVTPCDIYIEYYEKDSKQQIGHFSIHYKTDDSELNEEQKKHGRIHLKNNLYKTYYPMKCKIRTLPNANSSVTIYYETWRFMKDKLKHCINATLDVLDP